MSKGPRATLDRIEGRWAVLIAESGEVRRPRTSVSPSAREGDVIDLDTGEVDAEATEDLRREVQAARERAHRNPGPGGSFDL
jgi:hypothetical protein